MADEFTHTPFDYWDVLHTVVFLIAVWSAGYVANLVAAPALLVSERASRSMYALASTRIFFGFDTNRRESSCTRFQTLTY